MMETVNSPCLKATKLGASATGAGREFNTGMVCGKKQYSYASALAQIKWECWALVLAKAWW